MLRRHPAVDQGAGTPRAAQMFHAFFMGLPLLPSRQLDQRLVISGADALEAIVPRQPPKIIVIFLAATHIALKTFASRHSELSCR
jgi:hypothetical protein